MRLLKLKKFHWMLQHVRLGENILRLILLNLKLLTFFDSTFLKFPLIFFYQLLLSDVQLKLLMKMHFDLFL